MSSPVLETFPLGLHWPTIDPFLFCAHHLDEYPAGTADLAPAASLEGRNLGEDFAGKDGWRMYHGQVVPGFPSHPHRGFETVTYVRRGIVDHADSMGAAARFGRGDVQWITTGGGVVHSEMFPLLDRDGPNTLEIFQIWLNLPSTDKLVEPHFAMFWGPDVPRHVSTDADGRTATVTVIAGSLDGCTPPQPPPHSWAARPDSDVALWHVVLDPGASWTMPPAADGSHRVVYAFDGDGLTIDDPAGESVTLDGSTGARVEAQRPLSLVASAGHAEVMVMQGRPIAEPVAQYGPFVMNDRAQIQQALEDYQRTQFGGWPWDSRDPDHGPTANRFAIHADGRREEAPVTADA